jgi:hypothetical protein
MSTFNELVSRELEFARNKFTSMNSLHEGYAVLLEEVEELWDWIKQKQEPEIHESDSDEYRKFLSRHPQRNQAAIIEELVQIAAMAQRIYEDVAQDGNKVHK